ncbi:hypothetical protein [Streptomyces sp. JJ36]|uniref:hypothetical protein n=1 Tax=Streptomyces sp. JJ36 TaxID=2736645 RepID=UPI001F43FD48|nr:hypothetical protein [Streptomyces sp. JJ36]MCF6524210.1 hypothetical protein [Streptomyces sp. JJ36]
MSDTPRAADTPSDGAGGWAGAAAPAGPGGPGDGGGHLVGHIALALGSVFLALAAVVFYAVHDLEEETDAVEGVRLDHSRGDVLDPLLGPGTARYEDGVEVTVTEPRPARDRTGDGGPGPDTRTFAFSVTYANRSDAPLSFAFAAPMEAWAGGVDRQGDESAAAAVDHVNDEDAARRLPENLAPGRSLTIPLRYRVAADVQQLTFMYGAGDLREDAYWELSLPL